MLASLERSEVILYDLVDDDPFLESLPAPRAPLSAPLLARHDRRCAIRTGCHARTKLRRSAVPLWRKVKMSPASVLSLA
jgi:hypothetical protein